MPGKKRNDNNLNFIRFIAAFMVLSGHMAVLIGQNVPSFLFGKIHELGVSVFFIIGGYLITKSWEHDPEAGKYSLKRFFRLYPEYFMCVVITTFILGPLVTNTGIRDYLHGIEPYLRNLRFYITYSLPGVFSKNPYPNAVNGSLWTQPIELMLYIITPILLEFLHLFKNRKFSNSLLTIFTVIFATVNFIVISKPESFSFVIYGTDLFQSLRPVTFWLIGTVIAELKLERFLNLQAAVIMLVIIAVIQPSANVIQIMQYFIWPYFVMSLGIGHNMKPLFSSFGTKYEISYGIYLYGFPVEQTVIWYFMNHNIVLGYCRCLAVSAIITCLLALLSFVLIQKPADNLKEKLLAKVQK